MARNSEASNDEANDPSQSNGNKIASRGIAGEMAQAFQELTKGEQTAAALERQLDGLESRIEELLAAAEASIAQSRLERAQPSTNGVGHEAQK